MAYFEESDDQLARISKVIGDAFSALLGAALLVLVASAVFSH